MHTILVETKYRITVANNTDAEKLAAFEAKVREDVMTLARRRFSTPGHMANVERDRYTFTIELQHHDTPEDWWDAPVLARNIVKMVAKDTGVTVLYPGAKK